MKNNRSRELCRRKSRIAYRLRDREWEDQPRPMFTRSPLHFEVAQRDRALSTGGIGVIHELAKRFGLFESIDRRVHLLKVHKPYHESDHVLNFAYSALCGGQTIEDLELLRTNEAYLDLLGAQRIPDPTTAGDFCRRFTIDAVAGRRITRLVDSITSLMTSICAARGSSCRACDSPMPMDESAIAGQKIGTPARYAAVRMPSACVVCQRCSPSR